MFFIFSPISKHLKLDFSMSHSDERSISEEISPIMIMTDYITRDILGKWIGPFGEYPFLFGIVTNVLKGYENRSNFK